MLKSKIFLSAIIFLILLIITSVIKNQTRIIEKKLYKLNTSITLKEKDINEAQLDFYFLSSPAEIEKKLDLFKSNDYLPVKKSNIFLSLSNFMNIKNKISLIDNRYEEKKN
mgnify:CR=1 FL=1